MEQGASPARTVILTVDDDPGVSRAVARDLRRRYGELYRIVRAESGGSALAALRELKLRGAPVAVIVADYRMPEMDGIQFLEQALDIHPGARRVLLTAYADTDAAIDAINVVDLDHYLLKPWEPPEEKLHPVLDDLLLAWRASGHRPVTVTRVVGHRWSARSSAVREFLARNQVPHRWDSSEDPEGRRLLSAAGQEGLRLPLVIVPDGTTLVEPVDQELTDRARRQALKFGAELLTAREVNGLEVNGASRVVRDHLLVEIRDTGPGVPAEIRDRVFAPFFTTKPVGEGTGLGLHISWRIIVNKHQGDLRFDPVPGDTRFQVRLPPAPTDPRSPQEAS
ncbi:response regulator [Streptomyces platensis]|uniref:ATP-binding protein n=1 Tax=Streptomyces platensis TaxID=58346 RepID=UPI0030E186F5